jgi:Asp-tRNA(Asn)/Glu-tRNA(Gln) amidotransferase A subunit family amidase
MHIRPIPLAPLAQSLRLGTINLKEYINELCDRIDAVDQEIEAFLPEKSRRSRLLEEADLLLGAYPETPRRPPLFGVPFGVKDIFHVDGFPTRAGSRLDPERLTGPEAECVRLLRQAGALVLGKTVTTEFAYFEPGPTRNPYHLNHTPGGSSSGSAAAVAAGMCPLSLGTQTIGSVNRPAAFCGVIGFKPSYGRIPTDGVLYFSRSADHVGCFTQDIGGMSLAATVLCYNWQEINVNYKPVLGIPKGKYLEQTEPDALNLFYQQLEQLQQAGYEYKEVFALNDIDTVSEWHRKLITAEMAFEHRTLYADCADLYRPKTVEIIREGKTVTKDELVEARRQQKILRDRLETLMRDAGIDLWATPAAPGPAPEGIGATGNPAMNLPWTNSGLPSVSLPAGRAVNGLPLGLQLVAPFMGDELLLFWAGGVTDVFSAFQAYNQK